MSESTAVGTLARLSDSYTVLDLLSGAIDGLADGWPVVVEDRGDCFLLLPRAAVGQSDTRRLVDLPLLPATPVPFDTTVADTVRDMFAEDIEYLPVERDQQIIGVVSRGQVFEHLLSAERAEITAVSVLAGVLDNIREGVVLVGADQRVKLANRPGRKLLKRLTGTRSDEIIAEFAGEPFAEVLQASVGFPARDVVLEDGRIISSLFLGEASDDLHDVLLVLRDVTRARKRQAHEASRDRLVTLGELAGAIAHDFNNLLTVVIGHAYALERGFESGKPPQSSVAAIHDAAERAAALVRQLLAFGSRELVRPVVLDMPEMLRELEALLRRLIGEDVELTLEVAPDLWPVTADPSQIERVLANLVVNARHAMPSGGRLTLVADNIEDDDGRRLRLVVEDTGVGMPPSVVSRIFEPYFTTRGEHGTGLGLATVHGTVSQLGGRIQVESEVGQGTRFVIEVPAADDRPVARRGGSGPASAPSETLRVLLVEDDEHVARAVCLVVRGLGHDVATAVDAPSAQERIAADPPDVVLTDEVLGRGSGRELLAWCASRFPNVRRVLASGYAATDAADHAQAVLPKPFSAAALAAALADEP